MPARRWILPAILTLAAALLPREVSGCSCYPIGPPCQAAWNADAVFSGTVRAIDLVEDRDADGRVVTLQIARFEAVRWFLGSGARQPEIVQQANPMTTCEYRFQKGKAYMVYARDTGTGALSTSICSRTRPLDQAQDDVRYLTNLPPDDVGARIYGRVNEQRRHPAEDIWVDYGPVEHVPVTIVSGGLVRTILTGSDGRFEQGGLPAAPATVSVMPPVGFSPPAVELDVELRDPRACAEVNVTITPLAAVSGTVVDGAGLRLAGVEVDAVASELAGFGPPPHQTPARTDERGVFEFSELPPGLYVFGVNLTTRAGRASDRPAVFLPGTSDASAAKTIELRPGDRIDVGILRLAVP